MCNMICNFFLLLLVASFAIAQDVDQKIVNGEAARLGQFPYQVLSKIQS